MTFKNTVLQSSLSVTPHALCLCYRTDKTEMPTVHICAEWLAGG